jgi:peptidoglycan/LPS O-acetylase OafA/YrhL
MDKSNRFEYIDVLRSFAILGVLFVHTGLTLKIDRTLVFPNWFLTSIDNGARGVQLFYIISAFTIIYTYIKHSVKEKYHISNFYIRRFFRIAPMYYIAIGYYLFQNGTGHNFWLGDHSYISIGNIISNFLFIHGLNPYWINSLVPGGWSIAVEITFYIFAPFIVLYLSSSNFKRVWMFLVITILITSVLTHYLSHHQLISSKELWDNYLFIYFPNQLPFFILGILLYKIHTKITNLYYLIFIYLIILFINGHSLYKWGIFFLILFMFFEYHLKSNCITKMFAYVGRISYSMYLTHFSMLYWLTHIGVFQFISINKGNLYINIFNFILRFFILTMSTIVISSITYYLIEKKFIKFANMLIQRREQK